MNPKSLRWIVPVLALLTSALALAQAQETRIPPSVRTQDTSSPASARTQDTAIPASTRTQDTAIPASTRTQDKPISPSTQTRDTSIRPSIVKSNGLLSLSFRDAPIQDVFEMLARGEHVNIVLRKGVSGNVSLNLYNISVAQAIQSVAEAGGYAVEQPRPGEYAVMDRAQAGQDVIHSGTQVRTYKVQYSNLKSVADILATHLSRRGKITPLIERNLLVVEDVPESQERIARVLREIDVEPKQIMIEAKILEITLDESESFGIDWNKIFNVGLGSGIGTQGLASRGTPGLFFNLVNDKLTLYLNALNSKGRVHTLSTPRLLALENQEAAVVIGKQFGYKVTTTINLVTTESVLFLDTGVILRVTPSVDERDRILLKIHPEVSSGTITDGIPTKTSTEVTTQLLAQDGESVLIGGLIKNSNSLSRTGVPGLGDIPVFGALFANKDEQVHSSETVVLITPHIVRQPVGSVSTAERDRVHKLERVFDGVNAELGHLLPLPAPQTPAAAAPVESGPPENPHD